MERDRWHVELLVTYSNIFHTVNGMASCNTAIKLPSALITTIQRGLSLLANCTRALSKAFISSLPSRTLFDVDITLCLLCLAQVLAEVPNALWV